LKYLILWGGTVEMENVGCIFERRSEVYFSWLRSWNKLLLCAACLAMGLLVVSADGLAQTKSAIETLKLDQKWTGDFDGMTERHVIRALVPYSKTFYFLDGANQRGLEYELLKQFEKHINKKLKTKHLKVNVVVIPTKRDRLLPALVEGLGDIAAGNLTVTPERLKRVDFSDPYFKRVDEILVTGPAAPQIETVDDLAGKEIHVRASSSYYDSLQGLNARFKKAGKAPVELVLADEYLEDEDLLEMMNAKLIPMIIIDSHKGQFWKQIFTDLTLHPEIKVRTGGQIGWAVRKNSPALKQVINAFMKKHQKGTLMGNILFKRYLKSTKWVRTRYLEKSAGDLRRPFSSSRNTLKCTTSIGSEWPLWPIRSPASTRASAVTLALWE
jgi:membrane-bound lytic murein transglycosylase MltF